MTMLIHIAALIVIVACLVVVAIKVIWNVALPYGMIRMKEDRAISCFPLIEAIPLLLAMLVSWLTGQRGYFSAGTIGFYGLLAIVLSYVHFCVVSMIHGIGQLKRKGPKSNGPQCPE